MNINSERLTELSGWSLKNGNHTANTDGELCVMEAVSYIAGEPWSDHPQCACPVITAFLVSWNDALPTDADRDRLLKPLIPKLVGSRSSAAVAERRSYLALDWLIRVHAPKFLDLVPALAEHATALRGLEQIADLAGAVAAGKLTNAARDAARAAAARAAAARDAAAIAAWAAAAGAAVRDAAEAAVRDAAEAAGRDAAEAAVRDAAEAAAARNAVRAAAARATLSPTVEWLQLSAVELVERMLAVKEEAA